MYLVKSKAIAASEELMLELNEVLKKYDLGEVYLEAIRLRKGTYQYPTNCRKVCRIWTNPQTGEKKVICKVICK